MVANPSIEIVNCQGCGRDTHGGPYCVRCIGRGGRAQVGDGFRDRQGWRDVRVIAGSEAPDYEDDEMLPSERQWHGA